MFLTRHFRKTSNTWSTVGCMCPLNNLRSTLINSEPTQTMAAWVPCVVSASICHLIVYPQLSLFPPTSLAHYSKLPHSKLSFLLLPRWYLFCGTYSLPASSSAMDFHSE